ncbi:phenylalanine--tRNA ligase subunit beta [Candidatus Azambacteria bacterium]|nr:phenylalanine--tRNA ligase subunit beta [Candidatus Azambacteria bacterium]
MKVSYKWLQEYIAKKLPTPEKTAALLTMHAFEVEGIEKAKGDAVLDIKVLPNRAHDCLSHYGIARELAAIVKTEAKHALIKMKEQKKVKAKDGLKVAVREPELCARYTARVIYGVKIAPSPKWLVERLEALGQRSINNIVDATNYVMLALGQPLHAFDLDAVAGRTITVRKARAGETITTLDGDALTLTVADLVIADMEVPLAIAGVKGGKKAEVTVRTVNIALEAATFDAATVRKTSRRLNVRTESSIRFENGLSPALPPEALDMVAALIVALAGGEVASGMLDAHGKLPVPQTALFTAEGINKLLGTDIAEKEMLLTLKRLGFTIQKTAKGFLATAPKERLDVAHQADIAEEIARMHGMMDIASLLPESTLIPAEQNNSIVTADNIRTALAALGLSETYNRSFIGARHMGYFHERYAGAAAVANPLSDDQKYLRPSLLFGLLDNVAENFKHEKAVRLFEVGNIFALKDTRGVHERTMAAGVIAAKGKGKNGDRALFYEVKGIVDALLERLGIDDAWYDDYLPSPEYSDERFWHRGRTADIKVGDATIGAVGEAAPALLHLYDIHERVALFELDRAKLSELAQEKRAYQPIIKFPAIERDIAVVVPAETKIDRVQYAIETAGGELLSDSDLFDIYEGENLDAAQKSLAFHCIFQSAVRTLTDEEVNDAFKKITAALISEEWDVRS